MLNLRIGEQRALLVLLRKSIFLLNSAKETSLSSYHIVFFCAWQVCGITDRQYTYAEMRDNCAALAVRLQKLGYKQGQTLAVCLPNLPEFPIAALGALEAGLVVTTVNPIYTPG